MPNQCSGVELDSGWLRWIGLERTWEAMTVAWSRAGRCKQALGHCRGRGESIDGRETSVETTSLLTRQEAEGEAKGSPRISIVRSTEP